MICKKCGASISDASKFCTNCGEKVLEVKNNSNEEILKNEINKSKELDNNSEQTLVIDKLSSNIQNSNKKEKKYIWLFVLGSILIGIVILLTLILIFGKTTNSSAIELERVLKTFYSKSKNNGTINTNILIEADTEEISDTLNLTGILKYAKVNDNYELSLTINKSVLFNQIDLYGTIANDNLALFVKSSTIDILGVTSSSSEMWVYSLMKVDMEDLSELVKISEFLNRDNLKLIGEEKGIKHYQLIVDNKLLENFDTKTDFGVNEVDLKNAYYIDIYISSSNELVKVSMDLTDNLKDQSIKKAIINFEFIDIGKTLVQIPYEVKNTTMDLNTYMSTYMIQPNLN